MERARLILIMLSLHLLGHLSQAQEDEVIFITGGHSVLSSTLGTSTEVLDISSSSSPCSRTTGDLPDRRFHHSMANMGDVILICGGGYTVKSSTSCVSSRNASGPWLHHSTTNSKRWYHSSVVLWRNTLENFDEGEWTGMSWNVIEDGSCSVQTSHDSFIVTGGPSSRRRVREWKAGTWRELEEMKVGRSSHACGTIVKGGKVFVVVAGGVTRWRRRRRNQIQSSEVFADGKWQDMGDLVKARHAAKIVTVRVGGIQKMIIMGGDIVMRGDNKLNSVEELVVNDNVGQSTWKMLEATMKKARSHFGAVSVPKSKFCDN